VPADAAAGQPLDVEDRGQLPTYGNGQSVGDPLLAPPAKENGTSEREAENTSMVYGGAATDAAAAAEASHRRDANVNGGDGVVLDMTLPVATDIALSAGSREAAETQWSEGGQQSTQVEVTAAESGPVADSTALLGCFQLTQSSACGCPLGDSLELRRDGITKNELYELHGTSATAPPSSVSALAVPPETSQVDDANDLPLSPSAYRHELLPPPPLDELCEKQLDVLAEHDDLRNAAREHSDPTDIIDPRGLESDALDRKVDEATEGVEDASPEKADNPYSTEDGLDGEWLNGAMVMTVKGNHIIFPSGEAYDLEPTGQTTCHMLMDGAVFYGRLSPCRQKLLWSDGDVWTRVQKETALPSNGAAPETSDGVAPTNGSAGERDIQELPSLDVEPGSVTAESFKESSLDEAPPGIAATEAAGPPQAGSPSAGKQTEKPNKSDADKPRKRGLCACFGGGKKKSRDE